MGQRTRTVTFDRILATAARRKGGLAPVEARLPGQPASAAKLRRLRDEVALSLMSKGVFRAGFNWRVVENKWPGIEPAFHGFVVERVATMDSDDVEILMANPAVIRNRQRIWAVVENARWMLDVRDAHQSFGRYVANWTSEEIVDLWHEMKAHGKRLGGATAQYFLRELGKDSFLTTPSVLAALVHFDVIDRPTTSKKNLRAAQAAFNAWHAETGRPYAALSRIVAMSVDV